MDKDLETRVVETRRLLDSLREDKVRKEERLANLTKQKSDIEKQLKGLGLDPSKLEDIIKEKSEELEAKVAKFEEDTASLASALAAIQDKLAEA
jgi:chromosome segregation ATPase